MCTFLEPPIHSVWPWIVIAARCAAEPFSLFLRAQMVDTGL